MRANEAKLIQAVVAMLGQVAVMEDMFWANPVDFLSKGTRMVPEDLTSGMRKDLQNILTQVAQRIGEPNASK